MAPTAGRTRPCALLLGTVASAATAGKRASVGTCEDEEEWNKLSKVELTPEMDVWIIVIVIFIINII